MRAVALKYDGKTAPKVTAKAEDSVAADMLALAHKHGIPIHKDAALSATLSQMALDAEVPMALYVAVAEIIAFAYQLRGMQPPTRQSSRAGQTINQTPEH